MIKKDEQLQLLKALAKDISYIQKTIKENKQVKTFMKKNISLAKDWVDAYKKVPEPKLPFNKFCTLAVLEKLEKEGIIDIE